MIHISPRAQSPVLQWWSSIDRVVLCVMIGLSLFGVVMVATASPSVALRIGLDGYHFLYKHLLFLGVSLATLFILSTLRHQNIWRFATLLFAGSAVAMVVVLITGMEIKGAQRWLHIFGFGIQPSEFLKPGFIVLAAYFLAKQKQNENFPGLLISLGLFILSAFLLLLQPDFGMFFLLTLVFAAQIFLAGCPLRYIFILGGFIIVASVMAYLTLDHVQSRVDRYLDPQSGDNYQIDRAVEAFSSGGFFGVGPGQGTAKLRIPDVHADFIFAAIGEEWGFVFIFFLVALYGFMFFRIMNRLARSDSLFVMMAGSGLVMMLAIQCFIHMGSSLGLIPTKGMTLPLISYGGSSLVSVGISCGLILALSRGIMDNRKASGWRSLKKETL